MVMTMVINNKWLLCTLITHTHTYPHSHTHLDQTLKSLLCHFWNYGITKLFTTALCWSDCLIKKKKKKTWSPYELLLLF